MDIIIIRNPPQNPIESIKAPTLLAWESRSSVGRA